MWPHIGDLIRAFLSSTGTDVGASARERLGLSASAIEDGVVYIQRGFQFYD
jgi:hypothetical protein